MCIRDRMVVDLLISKPDDIVDFLVDWFNTRRDSLKKEFGIVTKESPVKRKDSHDDDEDEVEDLPMPVVAKRGPRNSVSAEAYGIFNKKQAYVAKVIQKGEDQKRRIRERLEQAFMFNALDEREKEIVVNAMEERRFK
eukprot:TRINITY_DN4389_c0_g1_i9.p1 TRINITY_DN4389_c0_g1~~TRINITY_DN4389_c0_g1_i9.p1  ORF type:complete len:158 (+),score=54.36 TRINITY_DN4389_c0_g1_i9:61-474(+)